MDVERHFLRVRGPSLVAEAVDVFAVRVGVERVVLRRDGVLVVLTVALGVLDLEGSRHVSDDSQEIWRVDPSRRKLQAA